jgi:hypothetical protein
VPNEKKYKIEKDLAVEITQGKVKFEVYGEEMIEKKVKLSSS